MSANTPAQDLPEIKYDATLSEEERNSLQNHEHDLRGFLRAPVGVLHPVLWRAWTHRAGTRYIELWVIEAPSSKKPHCLLEFAAAELASINTDWIEDRAVYSMARLWSPEDVLAGRDAKHPD